MLEDTYRALKKTADTVNWSQYNNSELFRQYILNEDTIYRDAFYAGIVCRYWGHIGRMYSQCGGHITIEQCYDCIIDAINYVLKKRAWENPNSSIYNDPAGPDKAMHVVMVRQKCLLITRLSADKRLSDFNTYSIDGASEEYNDASEGLMFGDKLKQENTSSDLSGTISKYFAEEDYISAAILDTICFREHAAYKPSKIVKAMRELTVEDYPYFRKVYNLSKVMYNKLLYSIRTSSSKYLQIKVRALLHILKEVYNDGESISRNN